MTNGWGNCDAANAFKNTLPGPYRNEFIGKDLTIKPVNVVNPFFFLEKFDNLNKPCEY